MIGSSQLEAPVRTVDHDVCGRKLETDLLRLGHIKAWRPEDYRTPHDWGHWHDYYKAVISR